MKKFLSVVLAVAMLLSMCSLGLAENAEEPVKLTVLHATNITGTNYSEYGGWDIIRDKLNIEVEFVHIDPSVSAEQFSIMLNNDNLPDVIMGIQNQFANSSEIAQLGQQGYLIPLNDLIDQYAPTIKGYLENDPYYKSVSTAPDGNVYALPHKSYGVGQNFRLHTWINTAFLDALNMEMPTTVDELYAYLKGVKENDVNGNGDPNDEIPMMSFGTGWNGNVIRSNVMTAFAPVMSVTTELIIDNGTVCYAPATDGFREGLKFISKLYSEGLIYQEAFSSDRSISQSVCMSGGDTEIAGMVFGHNFLSRTTDGYDTCIVNWEVMPALEGGSQPYDPYATYELQNAISANCKNPEAAMRLLEFFATEEGTILVKRGIEDINWTAPHEGATLADGVTPAEYRYFTNDEKIAMGLDTESVYGWGLQWGWCHYENEKTEAYEVQPNEEGLMHFNDKYCNTYLANAYADVTVDPANYWNPLTPFSEEALLDVSLYQTNIMSQMTMAVTEFAMGVRDINDDAAWAKYLAELDSMGLQEYLNICQEAYDQTK